MGSVAILGQLFSLSLINNAIPGVCSSLSFLLFSNWFPFDLLHEIVSSYCLAGSRSQCEIHENPVTLHRSFANIHCGLRG